MADDRRILVIADTPTEMGQTILRGVVEAVARAAPGWQIDRYATRPWPDLAGLQRDRPAAGFVAHVGTAAEDEQIAAMGVPAVNTSNVLSDTALPRVCTDDVAAGRMAAEYLRGRGFERVYFHGTPGHAYMVERLAGVRAVLGEANVTTIGGGEDDLKKAVASAEPPIAVISTDDYRATAVCRAAAACGRSVPVDVAALGFNDDALACELQLPTQSSVQMPFAQIGARAVSMLLGLIDGRPPADRDVRIPPIGVVERHTTSVAAVLDEPLRAALARIEQTDGLVSVPELLDELPISQRSLEGRFKRYLGQTPHQYLTHRRAAKARRLLAGTSLTITQIALACGFSGASHMDVVFRRLWDTTPSAVRRSFTGAGTDAPVRPAPAWRPAAPPIDHGFGCGGP